MEAQGSWRENHADVWGEGSRQRNYQAPRSWAEVSSEALCVLTISWVYCPFNLIWSGGIFKKSRSIACQIQIQWFSGGKLQRGRWPLQERERWGKMGGSWRSEAEVNVDRSTCFLWEEGEAEAMGPDPDIMREFVMCVCESSANEVYVLSEMKQAN